MGVFRPLSHYIFQQQEAQLSLTNRTMVFCNAKFGDLGDNGDRGSKYVVKVPYLESPTLIFLFTMQLLWGYNDD